MFLTFNVCKFQIQGSGLLSYTDITGTSLPVMLPVHITRTCWTFNSTYTLPYFPLL